MPTLIHHPLCPHSRFVRLILAEYGIETQLIEERVIDRNPRLLASQPGWPHARLRRRRWHGGSGGLGHRRISRRDARRARRARRGCCRRSRWRASRPGGWSTGSMCKFFDEVTNWLVTEKVYKRFASAGNGGGAPDMDLLRVARANIRPHMRYIGYLTGVAQMARGRQFDLRRFRRRRAYLLRRLSRRRALGRGRVGQALVSAHQVASRASARCSPTARPA